MMPSKVSAKVPAIGTRRHFGTPEEVGRRRRWRNEFTEDERAELRSVMGDAYSDECVREIESAIQLYFDQVCRGYVRTMSDERRCAELIERHSLQILGLLGSGRTEQRPITSFRAALEWHFGGPEGVNQLFQAIGELRKVSSNYVQTYRRLPRIKPTDAFKELLAQNIAMAVARRGLTLGKGRNTHFHKVLTISFELLGEDSVKDPYDFTLPDYRAVLEELGVKCSP